MAKQRKKKPEPPMGFVEFAAKYSTEEACRERLFEVRKAQGFMCPKCGSEEFYNLKTRGTFQCKKCRYQKSLTVGTLMEGTHIKLQKWFWAIYLVATDKRGISAMALMRQLHVTYKTAWFLLHRIRQAMGKREEKYTLCGIIEFDDAYFGGTHPGGKRGRGSDKAKALVAVSKDQAGRPKFLKLLAVPDLKGKTIKKFARENFVAGAKVETDACRSYRKPLEEKYLHEWQVFDADAEMLEWLHIAIGNAKAFIQGTYHGLDKKHLQRYFNEFGYRYNRRHLQGDIFDRLLAATVSTAHLSLAELRG
jgi:transposase-like protein